MRIVWLCLLLVLTSVSWADVAKRRGSMVSRSG